MRSQAARLSSLTASLAAVAALVAGCSSDSRRGPVTWHTELIQYNSCADLEADLKDAFIAEMEALFEEFRYSPVLADGAAEPGAESGGDNGGERQEGVDYSGTNNQEEGVDEADFVKTDGYHVYVLNGNRLHIFGVPEFGQLVPESEFTVEGEPRQMLINRDAGKAVVFSTIYVHTLPEDHPLRRLVGYQEDSDWMWRVGSLSKLTVVDISDRTAPTLQRELYLEGGYQTARMVDGSVRMGTYSWMYIPGLYDWWWYYNEETSPAEAKRRARTRIEQLELADMIPMIYERDPNGTFTTHSLSQDSCRSFYRPSNSHGSGFTSLLSLDLFNESVSFDADHVVSNWSTVYSSQDYLYIAEPANNWWWFWWNEDHPEQLNVHMFDIRVPGQSLYLGSGRVEGQLHNQFSLDEHEGYLRVATTTNRWARWWLEDPPEADNHVYVMDLVGNELVTVGHVDNIARGEAIFSARLVGDKGYLVTFRNTDPLFTLDLRNPREPRVIGELEVFGFSTYIHPIADDKLLTIGVGGDENGANWRTQVSMFDVGDFANPTLFDQHQMVTDGEWGWSEALYEHKAFQYFAPQELLAVPMSSSRSVGNGWEWISNLELVSVQTDAGLASYGSIDHSHLYNTDDEDDYWWSFDIRRSIFMGDYIYAISDRGITVHDLDNVSVAVAEEQLPGRDPNSWYWWW